MPLTLNSQVKTITALSAIVVLCLLASCLSSAPPLIGGAASIAQAQANATATAEVIATATALQVMAQQRLEEAYARKTQVAQAGVQSTLVAQDLAINEAAIAAAKVQVTQQVVSYRATATEIAARATDQAVMRTATVVAIVKSQQDGETNSRFWSWVGFVLLVAIAIGLLGGAVMLIWSAYLRMAVRQTPDGSVYVIKGKPQDLLRRDFAGLDVQHVRPVDPLLLSSANPENSYDPMITTQGRANNRQASVVNKAVPSKREVAWDEFLKQVEAFTTVVYEYCRDNGTAHERIIPRWETLADYDESRTYINSRWWSAITSGLEAEGILAPKEQGKRTKLADGEGAYRNITDLHIAAVRKRLLPSTPPSWFRARGEKSDWNSDSSEQLAESEQLERSTPYPGPDHWIWLVPENT